MKLSQTVIEMLQTADAKALATCYDDEVNVVPVSTIKAVGDTVWLMNYFMGETLVNIGHHPHVALACWKGLEGIKIKATVTYETTGVIFEEAKEWVADVAPTRILKGVLILTPTSITDVTPVAGRAGAPIV